MDRGSVAAAIVAAVESAGVPWGGRERLASPDDLAAELLVALARAPASYRTPAAVASMIGECAQETDWYTTAREYGADNARYAPYIGRGMVQCTWHDNYVAFGQWAGIDAVAEPWLLEQPPWRWLTAIWYYTEHIPEYLFESADWDSISGIINAGDAGYRGPSFPARNAACWAAHNILIGGGQYIPPNSEIGDDMPSASEVADAILGAPITRRGLPDDDPRGQVQCTVRDVLEWADARDARIHSRLSDVPGASARTLLDEQVVRCGLPDDDPRAGEPVTIRELAAWTDARAEGTTRRGPQASIDADAIRDAIQRALATLAQAIVGALAAGATATVAGQGPIAATGTGVAAATIASAIGSATRMLRPAR